MKKGKFKTTEEKEEEEEKEEKKNFSVITRPSSHQQIT